MASRMWWRASQPGSKGKQQSLDTERTQMTETDVDLGTVTAPSGMLVLGMAGWIDYWPQIGRPLSERARTAIAAGGGHLHGPGDSAPSAWMCEAIAVAASADWP